MKVCEPPSNSGNLEYVRFAERDRLFRVIVTVRVMLHGYESYVTSNCHTIHKTAVTLR